ncbi:MAG: T9SS type A sorting domain-containing protein [Bacteroidales bacterium]|nr:T9SS type A sorting domain-containing protein [Bacteroidales bacterium]
MKKVSLLLGVIFLISAFVANGQIVTKYQQGFESTGETYSYTSQGNVSTVTNVYSSGQRSIKLQQTVGSDVIVTLDTIDFTDNSNFQYFYLEFMHICTVDPLTGPAPNSIAIVQVKKPNETQWSTLTGNLHYDVNWGGGSSDYVSNNSFSERSYEVWRGSTINNSWWKRERYKLETVLLGQGTSLSDRKLEVRFVLKARNSSAGPTTDGWYLDNINVKCSPNSMLLPVATLVDYPDLMNYPNSRNTHISADISTTLAQGMNADSIYCLYQLGRSAPIRRVKLDAVPGVTNRYETYLPFCGYDTVVYWRIVAKDNTINHNSATIPSDATSWNKYKSVRGSAINSAFTTNNIGTTSEVPFSSYGDYKCQIVYDSAEMAQVFKPGAISQIRFPVASNVSNSTRNRFIVKMCNIGSDFVYNVNYDENNSYYGEYQKLVYDSSLVVTQNANTWGTINLQDTFYYAGKGLLITMICDNTSSNPSGINVRTFPSSSGTYTAGSIYKGYGAEYSYSPFDQQVFNSGLRKSVRPNFMFKINANLPLYYDCGISGFINPNDSTPANAVGTNDVVVTLKNYGSQPINAVRIYYSVDNGAHQYFDWTGNLAGGATTNVTISTTQTYPAGYHEMLAWVDDSVLHAGVRYRDHEPFNDTLWTRFISCDGPMSGVRTVGGANADYVDLEKMLYALSQCGVNGPLTVKLAGGLYGPIVFPYIPGASSTNYILFEPATAAPAHDVLFNAPTPSVTMSTPVNYIVNLQQAQYIRFKRINFGSNATESRATYLVRMGTNSVGCQFEDCVFTEGMGIGVSESFMTASALLYSGGADSLIVKNCTFTRGNTGLSLVGPAQDNMAHGSKVLGNYFQNQGINSMIVRNQYDAEVDSNTCDDVYANSSYCILLQDCSGATKVTRNTVYVTSGASCIGATNFFGSATAYAVVANNMLVSADNGTSNMLTTPLNIITANYAKILFNSIKLTAPTRGGIATATFGGGVLENSYFYNNIIGCYDTVNVAFSYIPTEGATNYIGYNIYYSLSPVLNKYDGINCFTMANWQSHCAMDANSQNVNPAFLNSYPTDLRSYSQNVKEHGIPFAEVQNDIFGTARNNTAPCVGAFEFSALPYDFEVLEYVEPYDEYCVAPTAAPLIVVIKNTGVNAYNPATATTPVQLSYSRSTAPGIMVPGASGNITINRTIPATDTIIYNTGVTIPFPTQGMNDTTYKLYTWFTSTIDPNPANDTSFTNVTSHYHFPAPASVNVNSDYGDSATATVTGNLQTWYSNVYTASPSHQSSVYWYKSPTDVDHFWVGNTLHTDPLYNDTTFYVRQKRDYPLVKITEVQIKRTQPGATYPMPLWMNSTSDFSIELTNIGDYPANLFGDTIQTVSNTSALRNVFRMPNVTIMPGQTLVVQFGNGINNVDSTITIGGNKRIQFQQNQNIGVIYKRGGVIADAVAINGILSQTQWTSLNVPQTVWYGPAIQFVDTIPSAGVYRKSWPAANASYSNTVNRWQIADDNHRMTLGRTNENLVRFRDNGCLGDVATVNIHLINHPDVDMAIDNFTINDGCGMGQSPLTITVHNHGTQPSGQVVLNYRIVGSVQTPGQANALQLCSDTIAAGLAPGTTINHTFSLAPDFTVNSASVDFDMLVWINKISSDIASFNDTVHLSLTSMFTPGLPNVNTYDTVSYGNVAVLHSITPPTDSLAWYDRNMNPLDTCNVYTTGYLYEPDTFYVSSFGAKLNNVHVGTLATSSNASGYPSPYNPKKKYVKEQYLFLAQDLIDAGHTAGNFQSLSFYLDTILGPAGTMTFTDYVISLGTTTSATFTSNSNWQAVTPYYSASSLTLTNADKGWVNHFFTNSFYWNGVDNIVVQITRSINPAISQGARTRYTNGGNNRVLYKNDDNNADLANFTGTGSRSANRPDIRFGFIDFGCEGPSKPVYIAITDIPNADASISWADDTVMTFNSCDTTDIDIAIRNMGIQAINGGFTVDYWIDNVHGVYNGTSTIGHNQTVNLTVAKQLFTPGRHYIRTAVTLPGDTVQTNDTIARMINVRFCAGTYAIGATGLYHTFGAAVDTLTNAGVDGPVVFSVQDGLYNEQVTLGPIDGASAINRVRFVGDQTDPSSVVLYSAPTASDNYVLNIDGAQFVGFEAITFRSRGTTNNNNVITISNASQIRFDTVVVRVKGGVNNNAASCIIVGDNVHTLYVNNSELDSGYYSIKASVSYEGISEGVYVTNNTIHNFMSTGLHFRKVNDVYISMNQITTGANANRALTGIFAAQIDGPITVLQNNIVLSDNYTGQKQGVKLVNISTVRATASLVASNVCAMNGKNNNNNSGIWIDSCTWMNVFFNTCRLTFPTFASNQTSSAMHVGTTSSEINVMNNILCHDGTGYSLFVQMAANIGNCDYNDYWSARLQRVASWEGNICIGLEELRVLNHKDNNSHEIKPYFVSETDLHLTIGNLCERAQYNTLVPNDFDNEIRPQIPNPTIGADEFFRKNHNIAVVEIYTPFIDYESNTLPANIEGDTLWIKTKLTNDGTSTESNLRWWAYVKDTEPLLRTTDHTIMELLPQESVVDSNFIVMPLGVIDTQTIVVVFPLSNDSVPENNVLEQRFFLDPAYNFRAATAFIYDESGCRLFNTPVGVELTNVGRKTFPAGTMVPVGFQAVLNTPNITVSTLPVQWEESVALPVDVEPNASVILNYSQTANLYPTGNDKDIVVRARAWSKYQYDWKPANDTTNYINHNSYYTPKSPVGVDINIPYATWDTLFASQTDTPPNGASVIHRPILWFRDSTQSPYHPTGNMVNNYNRSTWWETPQYFHDSTYFLCCVSAHGSDVAKNCTSYFSPIHVNINPRVPVDMAVLDVVEPVGNRVYMTRDSVKVALINYGTQPQTNIPVVYELYNLQNNMVQSVREICTATIQPDSVYVFRFDSLLNIPSWSTSQAYHLRTWTDMPNELIRLNDTLRERIPFYAVPDNVYPVVQVDNSLGLDITRVAFSSLDNQTAPAGHAYLNFTNSSTNNASINYPTVVDTLLTDYCGNRNMQNLGQYRALHLTKGTVDTMIVECMNSDRAGDMTTSGWLSVWVDVDRDGSFRWSPMHNPDSTADPSDSLLYNYPYTEIIYQDTIVSGHPKKFVFQLPEDVRTGYMRMRVEVRQGSTKPQDPTTSMQFGQVQDYLLYVQDVPRDIDLAAARVVSPREQQIGGLYGYGSDTAVTVTIQIANKGSQTITSADVNYRYINSRSGQERGSLQWTGLLEPGHSTVVELPARVFPEGVTDLILNVSTPGDVFVKNDTLRYQYYRSPLRTLYYTVDFERDLDWFIPKGYTPYTQNLWQMGHSNKPNIVACVSDSNILATNINGLVNVAATGNVSYAYTPIFDIATIRPDTVELWVARDMASGHLARIEYINYLGQWTPVGTGNDTLWYNAGSSWDSVSSGYGYDYCRFSLQSIASDFMQRLQFRFVYKVAPGSSVCDGVAFDNIKIGRADRPLDVGVIAITYPTEPKFGQTISPRVVVKNFGLDTLHSIALAYLPYGANLPKIGTYTSTAGLLPGQTDIFEFPTPFVVKNDFPDTFQICAYSIENMDIYKDNDTVCSDFFLSPLDNDMGLVSIINPLERCIAGDSIVVTARIRNYGQAPVSSTRISYVYNNTFLVTETVDFNEIIGHDLQSFEYLNYSFKQKFRSSMGIMNLMAYVQMDNDDYPYNDTVSMKVEGLSAITDLKARAIVVDTTTQNQVKIQVIVDNIGAHAVNDFKIGFWYYKDTSTRIETVYHGDMALPALRSLYYKFPDVLPAHSEFYKYVTAYVYADGDNDRTNDTTELFENLRVDLRPIRALVEENRTDSCRVRVEYENIGTLVSRDDQQLEFRATINGTSLKLKGIHRAVHPGDIETVDFTTKIPKSPTRTYNGSLRLLFSDADTSNNHTTRIEVVNYLTIPFVESSNGMMLEQNYPNPYENTTRIDFYLPTAGDVRFFVMDELGRLVFQSVKAFDSGNQSIDFNGSDLTTGTYYYGIEKDGERLMRKMVLKR